jgi:hypothetical protein
VDRYRIVEEPTAANYGLLLDFMRDRATTMSLALVGSGRKSRRAQACLDELRPYLVDASESAEWPGTRLMEGYSALLHRFSVSSSSVAVLRNAADGLYSWQAPELPDDLCFYRADGTALLGSTAHERESELRLERAEYAALLRLAPGIQMARVLES